MTRRHWILTALIGGAMTAAIVVALRLAKFDTDGTLSTVDASPHAAASEARRAHEGVAGSIEETTVAAAVTEPETAGEPELAADATNRIRGTVHTRAGEALAGARVELMSPEPERPFEELLKALPSYFASAKIAKATVTGTDGSFVFDQLTAGRWIVRAAAKGFTTAYSSKLHVASGSSTTPVRLVVDEGVTLEIEIDRLDGGMPGDIEICLGAQLEFEINSQAAIQQRRVARANELGKASIADLRPGRYLILVRDVNGHACIGTHAEAPGTARILIEAGAATIDGRVVYPDEGGGVPDVVISLLGGGERTAFARATTDAGGAFRLGPLSISDGMLLFDRLPSGWTVPADKAVLRDCIGNVSIEITLQKAIAITGTVVVAESDEPVPFATVHSTQMSDEMGFFMPRRASTQTDEHGRFELAGIAPGKTLVWAQAPGYFMNWDKIGDDLPPAEGGVIKDVIIALHRGAVIRGHVTDREGTPVEGAQIALLSSPADVEYSNFFGVPIPGAASGRDGRFELPADAQAIPNGCHLRVWHSEYAPALVAIPNSNPEAKIREIPVVLDVPAEVRGRVRREDGTPAVGLAVGVVSVREPNEPKRPWDASIYGNTDGFGMRDRTNSNGEYCLKLPPGVWKITIDDFPFRSIDLDTMQFHEQRDYMSSDFMRSLDDVEQEIEPDDGPGHSIGPPGLQIRAEAGVVSGVADVFVARACFVSVAVVESPEKRITATIHLSLRMGTGRAISMPPGTAGAGDAYFEVPAGTYDVEALLDDPQEDRRWKKDGRRREGVVIDEGHLHLVLVLEPK